MFPTLICKGKTKNIKNSKVIFKAYLSPLKQCCKYTFRKDIWSWGCNKEEAPKE